MSDKLKQTIRIKRGEKVGIDGQGHSVWTKPVEELELELVSTVMLRKILDSDDEEKKQRIRSLAEEDGVLASCPAGQNFEIVSDDELETALAASNEEPAFHRPADVVLEPVAPAEEEEELSLVSTQVLRQMLSHHDDDASSSNSDEIAIDSDSGGYNPYDKG